MKSKKDTAKINAIKKDVKSSIKICHKQLTDAIFDLCRETGLSPSVPVMLTKTILLETRKQRLEHGIFHGYETRTILCNKILWSDIVTTFFMLEHTDGGIASSNELSIDNLLAIYDEMLNVLKRL